MRFITEALLITWDDLLQKSPWLDSRITLKPTIVRAFELREKIGKKKNRDDFVSWFVGFFQGRT